MVLARCNFAVTAPCPAPYHDSMGSKMVVTVGVLVLSLAFQQGPARTAAGQEVAPDNHELKLSLALGSGSGDSSCLAENPPLACIPLTLALENHGEHAVSAEMVYWCGFSPIWSFSIEHREGDEAWQSMPLKSVDS
ncbi:MAG: hypothetical protein ACRD3O_19685, partial [Terriglobia bacterium]